MFRRILFGLFLACMIASSATTNGADAEIDRGLVGWWKMDNIKDGKVIDSSGKGNDGKVFGVTNWETGHIGKGALKITNFQEGEDITNGGVVIADSPLLRPSRFTVAMWVKWSRGFRQKALNRLIQKGNDNNETFAIIGGGGADNRGNADNAVSFAMATETRGDVHSVSAKGTFEGGKWYHVAATYDGSDMLLYVNGKVAGKNTIGEVKPIAVEGEPLVIGSRPPNMDRGFNGVVDDVRLYNKALSAADIRGFGCAGSGPEQVKDIFKGDKPGVSWDGSVWYLDSDPERLFVNSDGDLEWTPKGREQFVTSIREQRFSKVGDVVEKSYMFMSDGKHDCPDCLKCPDSCFDDDITCLAGTSDIRVGLFESVERGPDHDGYKGFKGYNFRFGPNMMAGPTRLVDCTDEVHKTGMFGKKPVNRDDLMSRNERRAHGADSGL
ncbi:MAG: LamG domain-containing protein [Planctomycetota bacterium]|jgi:hypothetical protein